MFISMSFFLSSLSSCIFWVDNFSCYLTPIFIHLYCIINSVGFFLLILAFPVHCCVMSLTCSFLFNTRPMHTYIILLVKFLSYIREKTVNPIFGRLIWQAQELDEVQRMRNTPDFFTKLVESVAPTVFGHQDIKRAILLMLMSGVHKSTHEGISLRGDINVCIVGDPSCAKSQFLKYCLFPFSLLTIILVWANGFDYASLSFQVYF